MTQQYKRKKLNLQVKKELQKWLLIRIFGAILVSSLVAGLILFFYARQEVSASFYEAHIKIRHVSDLLLPVVAAGAFVSLISGTILALFLPQKIAGPLFRMEKKLQEVQEGDLTTVVSLRENDTLKDFANTINNTIFALKKEVTAIKANHEELAAELGKEGGGHAAVLEKQKNRLDFFKVD